MQGDKQQRICDLLGQIPADGLQAVQKLFCSEFGYARVFETLALPALPSWVQGALVGNPAVVARFETPDGSFDIIHVNLRTLHESLGCSFLLSTERWIIGELLCRHPHSLFLFSDQDGHYCHLVNVPFASQTARRQVHRHLVFDPHDPLAVAARCLSRIDLKELASVHPSLSPQLVQQCHDRAFDPDAVAERFYGEFERFYHNLQRELQGRTGHGRWSRAYALEFLSRLLFICIVQRTGYLGGDARFLPNLWQAYLRTRCGRDSFVQDWLEGGLFKVLSSSVQARMAFGCHLPSPIRSLMLDLPYFEGGVCTSSIDTGYSEPAHRPVVSDAFFECLLEFLDSHGFTAREDTALDQQLAVGPAMLGRVYEGLVNSAEGSQRGETGIYYTAPTEAELMCRLALADWLANHLGHKVRSFLLQALFAPGSDAEGAADAALARLGLWPRIKELLDSVTVVDPACGSGSFLVGMFRVLDGMLARANHEVAAVETGTERRRRIAACSLYGVDLKEWAVAIARSRLSLQILHEPALNMERPATAQQLPDLSSKIVCGESLLLSAAEGESSWQSALDEVYSGKRTGFDLVIGNPPYVRQERIDDPHRGPAWDEVRNGPAYKARLARSVYAAWPRTFGYDAVRDRAIQKLDARSDLYIYFYFHGLALLHDKGSLCFVTSNAWLDARYGRDLQRFLLTRGQVKLLVDNQANRSFDGADINTVIVLLGAAHDSDDSQTQSLQNIVRFIVLRIAFGQAFCPNLWETLAGVTGRHRTTDFRVVSRTQAELLSAGMTSKKGQYGGDKWGSKYFRAPDIYWRIREQVGQGIVRLGDIAVVRRGVSTGANDFFFLDEEALDRWQIESEYLAPVLKSPRGLERIWLAPDGSARRYLFMCHRDRGDLKNTRALAYIEHGEAQGFHERPTCRRRLRWWDLGSRSGARVHCNYLVDRVMRFYASEEPFLASDGFQAIYSDLAPEVLAAACNSTLCQLSVNVFGRSNFGGGLLKIQTYEMEELLIPDPRLLGNEVNGIIHRAGLLGLDDPDRHALDVLVADVLGLTWNVQQELKTAVDALVAARVSKAQSPTGR